MATESDSVNTGALATIVIVGALAMVGITSALTALVRTQETDRRDRMDATANLQEYRQLVKSQDKELDEPPSWADKSKGIVRIPIKRAETLVLAEISKNPAAATPAPPKPKSPGEALYNSQGCIACHTTNGKRGVGPSWKGIWGSMVKLSDGSSVKVDEAYVRQSILEPQAKIVATFPPAMPSFKGKLDDKQISDLVDYIKSLK